MCIIAGISAERVKKTRNRPAKAFNIVLGRNSRMKAIAEVHLEFVVAGFVEKVTAR